MNIVILDDDHIFRSQLENIITGALIKNRELKSDIALSTADPQNILEYIRTTSEATLYFLDIKLEGNLLNGFDIAKEIRRNDIFSKIVIVTNFSEQQGFAFKHKIEAMDFISKDSKALKKDITECVLLAYKHQSRGGNRCLVIESISESVKIPYDKIYYICKLKGTHKVSVVSPDKTMDLFYNINKLNEKLISKNFFMCHRAYIVNMDKVMFRDTATRTLHMQNGHKCPYAKKYSKDLKMMLGEGK